MTSTLKVRAVVLASIFSLASGTALNAQPTKSYKDPDTGQDCVKETGVERSSSTVQIHYRNTCGWRFSIEYRAVNGRTGGTGIDARSDAILYVKAEDFEGLQWGYQ